MRVTRSASARTHLGAVALFVFLAIAWTWPLILRLHDAIPGPPGDNYSFLWYLWWMRKALASPDLAYFRTTWLFHPFGASITNNPHTALPALVAATVLSGASIVTAQNVLILAYVAVNMGAMYALAFDVTWHAAASLLAALIFGLSPYVAAHLPGHFELIAVWTLPAFALFYRRAILGGSQGAAMLAGLVAIATAYTSYYYLVYQGFFAVVALVAWTWSPHPTITRRGHAGAAFVGRTAAGVAAALAALAAWIAASGGAAVVVAGFRISATRPQGPLTAMWVLLLIAAACCWRLHVVVLPASRQVRVRSLAAAATTAALTVAGAGPLLLDGIRLMASGEYVTPTLFWRSAPRGMDLVAPLLGHPNHAWLGSLSRRAYDGLGLDPIEAVGWTGIVPLLLLLTLRPASGDGLEARSWTAVAAAFALWAAGPFLTIAGFDTGLKLPEILGRWMPFVANARMPGRAVVVVFMALAMLIALGLRSARGRMSRPLWQAAAGAAIVAEFWIAPITLTTLDRPAALEQLAAAPLGGVCEAPFGIGDGLTGTAVQDRRLLYDATIHGQPVVGGFLGRMPSDVLERYERMPVVADLLRLSNGEPVTPPSGSSGSPCRYVILHNWAPLATQRYVEELPHEVVARDTGRIVYRLLP